MVKQVNLADFFILRFAENSINKTRLFYLSNTHVLAKECP
jgi:hypothetical protein